MKINNIIFFDNYPKIDLHGLDSLSAEFFIKSFIEENVNLKKDIIIIIHGIGSGVLQETTKKVLKNHKKVRDYKPFYPNVGCTVAELII